MLQLGCTAAVSPTAAVLVPFWLLATTGVFAGKGWSYVGENGPDHWCHNFDECCGKQQSPVNIDTNTVHLEHIPLVRFHHYDLQPSSILVRNNGHSVYVDINHTKSPPMINDGGMGSNFLLVGFHFHWSAEHTIDGHRDPLELHFVHYNSRYGDLQTALKNPDGIAVLGVLFKLGKDDNMALTSVVKALGKVKYATENTSIPTEGFSLIDLMPSKTSSFYRYTGSLTTPECQEIVTWTVFETKNIISQKQLNAFLNLKANAPGEKEISMSGNYRPVQPLKGRKIKSRVDLGTSISTASIPCVSLMAVLAVFAMTYTRNYFKSFY